MSERVTIKISKEQCEKLLEFMKLKAIDLKMLIDHIERQTYMQTSMLNSTPNVQASVATGDQESGEAGTQK